MWGSAHFALPALGWSQDSEEDPALAACRGFIRWFFSELRSCLAATGLLPAAGFSQQALELGAAAGSDFQLARWMVGCSHEGLGLGGWRSTLDAGELNAGTHFLDFLEAHASMMAAPIAGGYACDSFKRLWIPVYPSLPNLL